MMSGIASNRRKIHKLGVPVKRSPGPSPHARKFVEKVKTWRFIRATAYKNLKHEKIGRNDPCPCGSGKKYKNCHGK